VIVGRFVNEPLFGGAFSLGDRAMKPLHVSDENLSFARADRAV
jgi:hypothetical protein